MEVIKDRENPAWPGGLDLTLCYTAAQAAALGSDAPELVDWADTLLWTLAALRSGTWGEGLRYGHAPTAEDWGIAVSELTMLSEKLEITLAYALVRHEQAGGSLRQIADGTRVSRSTAQGRRASAHRTVSGGPLDGWATLRPGDEA